MKPIIITKLEETKNYADTTYNNILQIGAARLQSLNFSVTIPAGGTQVEIPVDELDITTDTVIVDMNTRGGVNDTTITQSEGQRAKITISALPEDVVIHGIILKNVVAAQNTMSVSGSVIKNHTLSLLALNMEATNIIYSDYDANGIAKTVTHNNSSGQKVKEIVLSNPDGNLKYQTETVKYFNPGVGTPYRTKIATIVYSGNNIISKTWN